jgi:hypothetical protein
MHTVGTEAEKKEIIRAKEELETRENRKDIQGILDLLAEDFVFVFGDIMLEGKHKTEKMLFDTVKNYIACQPLHSNI